MSRAAVVAQGPTTLEASQSRQSTPAGLAGVAMRWVVDRLLEAQAGDPELDVVLPGGSPRQGWAAFAEIGGWNYRPVMRNPRDGANDQAELGFEVGIIAGSGAIEGDPFAAMDLADRVHRLLDEYERSEVVAIGAGEQRDVTLYLKRATVGERIVEIDELAVRELVVAVDQGLIESAGAVLE